jgi:hypothetical protein
MVMRRLAAAGFHKSCQEVLGALAAKAGRLGYR